MNLEEKNTMENKYTYSHFVKILYNGNNKSVSVFTNPTIESLTLDINAEDNDLVNIEVTDNKGRNIKLQDVYINKGLNSLSMNVSTLDHGIYNIHILNGKEEAVHQVQ